MDEARRLQGHGHQPVLPRDAGQEHDPRRQEDLWGVPRLQAVRGVRQVRAVRVLGREVHVHPQGRTSEKVLDNVA